MKSLLPSLKERNRYLVYEIKTKDKLDFKEVRKEILNSNLRFLGELETAKASVLILNDWKNNKGIIKISHKYVDKVRVALMLIKYINRKNVIFKTIRVSGTLKKARSFI
ncbi:MAG: ribonuclease P protein component 2 [Nanoarchaeota archaeon]|nr:ribonuclease P protein component 2 [Nanoarchaeota archaeon]